MSPRSGSCVPGSTPQTLRKHWPGCATIAPGGTCELHRDAELSAALRSGLIAADHVAGFLRLRQCILGQLAEISETAPSPAGSQEPGPQRAIRRAGAAARAEPLARRTRRTSVEAALATTQLALLRALNPDPRMVWTARTFRRAGESFPLPARRHGRLRWEERTRPCPGRMARRPPARGGFGMSLPGQRIPQGSRQPSVPAPPDPLGPSPADLVPHRAGHPPRHDSRGPIDRPGQPASAGLR